LKTTKLIIISAFVLLAFVLILLYLEPFAAFGAALLMASIGVTLFFVIDKWVLNEIDTIEEIKKGNIAYGLFMLAYAIVLAGSIVAAFMEYR